MKADDYLGLMRRAQLVVNAIAPAHLPLLLDALTAHAERSLEAIRPKYLLNEDWRAYARGEADEPTARLSAMAKELGTTPEEMGQRFREKGGEHLEDFRSTKAIYVSQALALGCAQSRHATYCTEEMSALIRSAATDDIAENALTVADLPSPAGVAYLYDRAEPLLLRWTTTVNGELMANLATTVGIRRLLTDAFEDPDHHLAQPYQYTRLSEPNTDTPPTAAQIVTPFGAALSDASIRATGALNTLYALAHLARQARLANADVQQVQSQVRDRKGRRRSRTDQITYLSYAARSSSTAGDGSRNYSHRWIVRGHWRRQWYPSQNRHVPIYITDHIAGPADLPIEYRDRVTIARPPAPEEAPTPSEQ